jgi:hypothetical protein
MVIFVILYVQNCIQEHTKTIISGKEMVCNRISYREWFVLPEIYNCILNSSWCFLEHNILFSDINKTIYALNLISNFYHDNVQTLLLPYHFEALTNEQIKHRNVWIFMAKIYSVDFLLWFLTWFRYLFKCKIYPLSILIILLHTLTDCCLMSSW